MMVDPCPAKDCGFSCVHKYLATVLTPFCFPGVLFETKQWWQQKLTKTQSPKQSQNYQNKRLCVRPQIKMHGQLFCSQNMTAVMKDFHKEKNSHFYFLFTRMKNYFANTQVHIVIN